ncbi:hypothetical protein FGO68_gene13784 [Halteria grandinella]|uniref:PX domain-containing protein n=1 Tax=Halteria grandinella TaxID=5974 RepID=A0A8J8T0A3_HALGN|nr:hypothetical protein FGO68_gene13784 [Halteria grandinella]
MEAAQQIFPHTISFDFIEWDQTGGEKATLYNIQVTFFRTTLQKTTKCLMRDRYSGLLDFHKKLLSLMGKQLADTLPEFPGKKTFGNKSQEFLQLRLNQMQNFFNALLGHQDTMAKEKVRLEIFKFIEKHLVAPEQGPTVEHVKWADETETQLNKQHTDIKECQQLLLALLKKQSQLNMSRYQSGKEQVSIKLLKDYNNDFTLFYDRIHIKAEKFDKSKLPAQAQPFEDIEEFKELATKDQRSLTMLQPQNRPGMIQDDLTEQQQIMNQNAIKLQEKSEKIDSIEKKAIDLEDKTAQFLEQARALRKEQEAKAGAKKKWFGFK